MGIVTIGMLKVAVKRRYGVCQLDIPVGILDPALAVALK